VSGRLTILNYHNVAVAPEGAALAKLYVDPRDFARQMWCLARLGIRGVSMSEGLWLLDQGRAGRAVAITFDDGYADNLELAAPILREQRFGATCFVVSGCVGTFNTWDADALRVRKPLMSVDQLRAWQAQGFELGSHTRSHPRLHALDPASAEAEIAGSRTDLERMTGARIDHFCYPYGSFNPLAVRQTEAAGYQSAVTTQSGIARNVDNRFLLPRMAVSGRRGLFQFLLRAATPYKAWRSVSFAT